MSRVPVIDSPCPYRVASMPIPGRDHCGHCDRKVHNLDGMNRSEREAFLFGCNGKVCVAYTVHRQAMRRNLSLGIGLATAVVGSVAMSAQSEPGKNMPVVLSDNVSTVVSPVATPDDPNMIQVIFVGGVNNPTEARWSDESAIAPGDANSVPEIGELDWLPSKAR